MIKVRSKKSDLCQAISFVIVGVLSIMCLTGCARNMSGGSESEKYQNITVYSSTGVEVYSYTGKASILDKSSGLIKFKDEGDKEHTVYYNDGTCVINEIDEQSNIDSSSKVEE